MSTIGWFLILMAGLVMRQVAKGRVMETPQDLSDAFLAIVSGDTKGFNAVLSRTGEYNQPDRADQPQSETASVVGGNKYNLDPKTKSHVISAANSIGTQFGIKSAGGWRAQGSVPGSKHPDGLALDLMINDIPNGKQVGDKIAEYAIANASSLGITEVIWWARIWSPGRGWRNYSGPSNHKDHVHLTFSEK